MARRARAAAPAERDASRPCVPPQTRLLLLLVVVAPEAATSATTAPAAAAASAIERNAVTDDAADITAAASFAYASSPSTPLTALGSNVVPGAVHFATYCDESNVAFHEGSFELPSAVGAVRAAASRGARVVLGTGQSPGVVFPVGDVSGGVRGEGADVDGGFVRLRAGEDVLACATAGTELSSDAESNGAASSRDVFLFATWTAPATIVKFAVDAATNSLERVDSAAMPPGVDYVRSAVAAADGTHSYFATDTSPAVIAKVRHSDLALVDVLVLDGGGERRNGSAAASYVRAGAMRPDGRASYWATHESPSKIIKIAHDDDDASDQSGGYVPTMFFRGAFIGDAALGESDAYSVLADDANAHRVYVGYSSSNPRERGAAATAFVDESAEDDDDDASASSSASFSFRRLDALSANARVPNARALLATRSNDGVAFYATRSRPAAIVAVDHAGAGRGDAFDVDDDGGAAAAAANDTRTCVDYVDVAHVRAPLARDAIVPRELASLSMTLTPAAVNAAIESATVSLAFDPTRTNLTLADVTLTLTSPSGDETTLFLGTTSDGAYVPGLRLSRATFALVASNSSSSSSSAAQTVRSFPRVPRLSPVTLDPLPELRRVVDDAKETWEDAYEGTFAVHDAFRREGVPQSEVGDWRLTVRADGDGDGAEVEVGRVLFWSVAACGAAAIDQAMSV